jgi:hypothetical protein
LEPQREQADGGSLQAGCLKILRELLSESTAIHGCEYDEPVNTVICDVERPDGRQELIWFCQGISVIWVVPREKISSRPFYGIEGFFDFIGKYRH